MLIVYLLLFGFHSGKYILFKKYSKCAFFRSGNRKSSLRKKLLSNKSGYIDCYVSLSRLKLEGIINNTITLKPQKRSKDEEIIKVLEERYPDKPLRGCYVEVTDITLDTGFKSVNNMVSLKSEGRRKHVCYVCSRKFNTSFDLQQHKETHKEDLTVKADLESVKQNSNERRKGKVTKNTKIQPKKGKLSSSSFSIFTSDSEDSDDWWIEDMQLGASSQAANGDVIIIDDDDPATGGSKEKTKLSCEKCAKVFPSSSEYTDQAPVHDLILRGNKETNTHVPQCSHNDPSDPNTSDEDETKIVCYKCDEVFYSQDAILEYAIHICLHKETSSNVDTSKTSDLIIDTNIMLTERSQIPNVDSRINLVTPPAMGQNNNVPTESYQYLESENTKQSVTINRETDSVAPDSTDPHLYNVTEAVNYDEILPQNVVDKKTLSAKPPPQGVGKRYPRISVSKDLFDNKQSNEPSSSQIPTATVNSSNQELFHFLNQMSFRTTDSELLTPNNQFQDVNDKTFPEAYVTRGVTGKPPFHNVNYNQTHPRTTVNREFTTNRTLSPIGINEELFSSTRSIQTSPQLTDQFQNVNYSQTSPQLTDQFQTVNYSQTHPRITVNREFSTNRTVSPTSRNRDLFANNQLSQTLSQIRDEFLNVNYNQTYPPITVNREFTTNRTLSPISNNKELCVNEQLIHTSPLITGNKELISNFPLQNVNCNQTKPPVTVNKRLSNARSLLSSHLLNAKIANILNMTIDDMMASNQAVKDETQKPKSVQKKRKTNVPIQPKKNKIGNKQQVMIDGKMYNLVESKQVNRRTIAPKSKSNPSTSSATTLRYNQPDTIAIPKKSLVGNKNKRKIVKISNERTMNEQNSVTQSLVVPDSEKCIVMPIITNVMSLDSDDSITVFTDDDSTPLSTGFTPSDESKNSVENVIITTVITEGSKEDEDSTPIVTAGSTDDEGEILTPVLIYKKRTNNEQISLKKPETIEID